MAIAFDAVGPSSSGSFGSGITTLSWSHTASGSNRLLLIGCTGSALNGTSTTSSISYGSQTPSFIGFQAVNNAPPGGAELYGLIAPATGAITITFTVTSSMDLQCGSVSYTGCDQVTGWKNLTKNFGSSALATGTVASVAAGDWVGAVHASGGGAGAATTINTGTSRWIQNQNTASGAGNGGQADNSGTGSVTVSWNIDSDIWGWAGIEIIVAGAAVAKPLTQSPAARQPRRYPARAVWAAGAVPGRRPVSVTNGLVRGRVTARAVWAGFITRTVNLRPGQVQLPATIQPRRTTSRALWRSNAVPPQLPVSVTGGLVRRRTVARAVWTGNAVPPRQPVSVTGGLAFRRTAVRASWAGFVSSTVNAPPPAIVPVAPAPPLIPPGLQSPMAIPFWPWLPPGAPSPAPPLPAPPLPLPPQARRRPSWALWGGLAALAPTALSGPAGSTQPLPVIQPRRSAARAAWRGFISTTTNLQPGNRPGGLVLRRSAARALWRGNGVPSQRPVPATGGLIRRRSAARVVWAGNAVPGQRPLSVTGGIILRRSAARAVWASVASSVASQPPGQLPPLPVLVPPGQQSPMAFQWLPQPVPAVLVPPPPPGPPGQIQPPSVIQPRRSAARAVWAGTVSRTANLQPGNQPGGLIRRRTAARAVWAGFVSRSGSLPAALPTGGLVRRRASARAVWAGNAVPLRRPVPVTGGAVSRRVPARAVWRGFISTTTNLQPGNQPGGLVRRRYPSRCLWAGTVTRTVNLPPGNQPGSGLVRRRAAARSVWSGYVSRTTNVQPPRGTPPPCPTVSTRPLTRISRCLWFGTTVRTTQPTTTSGEATSSVADPRDGTASLLDPRDGTASAADPRDGTASALDPRDGTALALDPRDGTSSVT